MGLKIYLLFFVLVLGCSSAIKAQVDSIVTYQLGGTVVDGTTNMPLIGAHIVSQNYFSNHTNSNGVFTLNVNIGDTLKVSYIGYKSLAYVVPINSEYKHLTKFKLYRDSVSLNEVEIFPWPTYEDFKVAFEELNLKNKEIKMEGVKMYQDRNIEPFEFKLYHSLTHPISFIYDKLFDKKAKLTRRINRRRNIIKKSSYKNSLED